MRLTEPADMTPRSAVCIVGELVDAVSADTTLPEAADTPVRCGRCGHRVVAMHARRVVVRSRVRNPCPRAVVVCAGCVHGLRRGGA